MPDFVLMCSLQPQASVAAEALNKLAMLAQSNANPSHMHNGGNDAAALEDDAFFDGAHADDMQDVDMAGGGKQTLHVFQSCPIIDLLQGTQDRLFCKLFSS